MPLWLLVGFSFVLVMINLIGALNFALVPSFFGVYGNESSSVRGRLITYLLWFFPLFSLLVLVGVWRSSTESAWLMVLPLLYLLFLHFIRANKQDTSGPVKRFSKQEQNVEEQIRELDYKWESWESLKGRPLVLCFDVWLPNLSYQAVFEQNILKSGGKLNPEKTELQKNRSVILQAVFSLEVLDREDIKQRIAVIITDVWSLGGELVSTEVEAKNSK